MNTFLNIPIAGELTWYRFLKRISEIILFCLLDNEASPQRFKNSRCCNWAKYFLSFGSNVSFAAQLSEWGSIMTMSDGYRSQHSPLNGVAIKMITTLTIKKYMKNPGNYDSHLVFNLEQLFHRHLFVLGDPPGPVHASEAAATAVLVEDDVIELDLHEGGAMRRHLIMTLSTDSASEDHIGRKRVWFSQQTPRWGNQLLLSEKSITLKTERLGRVPIYFCMHC